MPEYQVKIVDAFTSRRYAGNPCGVVTRAEGLAEPEMQAIARELNASETAFVTASTAADFQVRFFTPLREIPLAGHPTIATMHALVEDGRIPVGADVTRVTQEVQAGVLPVALGRDEAGHVRVVMTQATPSFGDELDPVETSAALGISPDDLLPGVPLQVVSTGTLQAMVPVRSLAVLQRIQPDAGALRRLEQRHGHFGLHAFALETFDPAAATHARHFAASAGIPEDPVTGSASGGMAAFLWRHGLLRGPAFRAEQGHIMGRPGIVEVEVEGDGSNPTVVRVAGTAVTVLTGTIVV